jgi:ParB-like chromosome segregation protein Spo0J
MKIHPAADLFPMMTEDELQELAADIAANGLLHPIIVDDDKQLIDGRNRLAACKIAQVEPRFERLNGHDPLAYIVSENIERRHLTKGQRAIALAMIYPEPEKGGRGKKSDALNSAVSAGFSSRRLNAARSVLRHSRDLAESVLKGSITLDAALAQVEEARQQADSTEAKHARLRTEAPDLAVRVAEENLELGEALTILHERELELRRTKEAGHTAARYIFHFAGHVASIHSAIAAGEDIRIPPDTMKTLADAWDILKNDMRRGSQ